MNDSNPGLLDGLRVVQLGTCLASAVCGRLFADMGAEVNHRDATSTPVRAALALGKLSVSSATGALPARTDVADARLIISAGGPAAARDAGCHPEQIRALNPDAVIVHVSPYGLTGPLADRAVTDLTLFAASGIAKLLIGQVDDPANEPPQRPVGEQSSFMGGIAAACAGMNTLLANRAAIVDVSIYEALVTLPITELTRAANGKPAAPRKRVKDGNGATVCILPCSDGYAAISPREEHQWQAWLDVMGRPAWGDDPRYATRAGRVDHWDDVHALMGEWSRHRTRSDIADAAQAAHVPSFALRRPFEHLASEQLLARQFFKNFETGGKRYKIPDSPFALALSQAPGNHESPAASRRHLPLSGVRILDFSWVIAGPTTTRYLAALGADVIKVEAPGRGDPGRTSELHTVLGQGKRGIVLNLKMEEGRQLARDLAQHSHVLVENFATGVMERFGLDAKTLRATNPGLSYVSASGLGREGPQAGAVAYGTLLQCYSGFAELNGIPGHAPKVGMAWLDPMCGLLLTFVTGACVYQHERSGRGTRIDFSMVEAMLWTMLMPLLECQNGGVAEPQGNASEWYSPHGMFATAGEDKWIALAVTNENQWRELCSLIPALSSYARWTLEDRRRDDTKIIQALQTWCGEHDGNELEALLASRDICAAVVKNAIDLANCEQLVAREFWDELDTGRAPGLPWRSSLDRHLDMAPGHGEHTDAILAEVLGLTGERINVLRNSGALG